MTDNDEKRYSFPSCSIIINKKPMVVLNNESVEPKEVNVAHHRINLSSINQANRGSLKNPHKKCCSGQMNQTSNSITIKRFNITQPANSLLSSQSTSDTLKAFKNSLNIGKSNGFSIMHFPIEEDKNGKCFDLQMSKLALFDKLLIHHFMSQCKKPIEIQKPKKRETFTASSSYRKIQNRIATYKIPLQRRDNLFIDKNAVNQYKSKSQEKRHYTTQKLLSTLLRLINECHSYDEEIQAAKEVYIIMSF